MWTGRGNVVPCRMFKFEMSAACSMPDMVKFVEAPGLHPRSNAQVEE